jgi:hypothetical protein
VGSNGPRAQEDSVRPQRTRPRYHRRHTSTSVHGSNSMRNAIGLVAATTLGVIVTLGVEAAAQSTKQGCASSPDMSRVYRRFDDLEQAITALQTQSAKAASDDALANTGNKRQLADISSQIADLNTQVVNVTGRLRTLPPSSR